MNAIDRSVNCSELSDEKNVLRETLMAWGMYRQGYNRTHPGFGRTIYDRMMSGLRGTTCGRCIGRGVVYAVTVDTRVQIECPVCKGKGKANIATHGKINPAMIPSTAGERPEAAEPACYQQIDKAMLKLTLKQRIVIISRYVDYPRRNQGEERAKNICAWFARIGESLKR